MEKIDLVELLEYASPTSILVVTYRNNIEELKCPFKVVSKVSVGLIAKGKFYDVNYIRLSEDLKIVYEIDIGLFYYHHFNITLK